MKKTIRVLIEAEYEVETDWYPEGATASQMVEIDLENDAGAFLAEAKTFDVQAAEFAD